MPGAEHPLQRVIPTAMVVRWEDSGRVTTQEFMHGPDAEALRHNLVEQAEGRKGTREQRYKPTTGAEVGSQVLQDFVQRLHVLQDLPADDQIKAAFQLRHP